MSKKQIFFLIVTTVIISWALNLLFGRQLVASISTLPVLNRWHVLSPEAPIVITKQETVRVAGGVDFASVGASVKSKISAIVLVNNGAAQITGSALNLTSDGTFITAASAVQQNPGTYYVVLNDGTTAKINSQITDAATSLTFVKTNLTGVPVAAFDSSANANPGDAIIFTFASFQNFSDKIIPGTVTAAQGDTQGQVFQSDYPSRGYLAQTSGSLVPGAAVFNSNSNALGMWNGKEVISSDVLTQALNFYLSHNQKISRPMFGFTYQNINSQEALLTGQTTGSLVKTVAAASPARLAGLEPGDVITSVNAQALSGSPTLEEILQSFKPGDVININITRAKNNLVLKLTVGELK